MKKQLLVAGMSLVLLGSMLTPDIVQGRVGKDNSSSIKDVEMSDSSEYDREIEFLMRFAHMPSLSAGIIIGNNSIWDKGYMLRRFIRQTPPTNNTVYLMASISKTITATAIFQLFEQGKFDLDDNVNKFLPFTLSHPTYPTVNITFRMLLAHHSGISNKCFLRFPIYFSFLGYDYGWLDEYLVPGGYLYHKKNWLDGFPPGTHFNYSNIGYEILGYIIEIISNQTFSEYCTEHIFEKLEMKNTSFMLGDYNENQLAVPYYWIPGCYIPLMHIGIGMRPSGGLRSSISDLSHFLIAHMNEGVYKGTRILNKTTVDLMHSISYPESFKDKKMRYGHGWMNITKDGTYYEGHSGGVLGGRSEMWYRSSDNIGVIHFWNQYEFVRFRDRPIEWGFQDKIEELLWLKADQLNTILN